MPGTVVSVKAQVEEGLGGQVRSYTYRIIYIIYKAFADEQAYEWKTVQHEGM